MTLQISKAGKRKPIDPAKAQFLKKAEANEWKEMIKTTWFVAQHIDKKP